MLEKATQGPEYIRYCTNRIRERVDLSGILFRDRGGNSFDYRPLENNHL